MTTQGGFAERLLPGALACAALIVLCVGAPRVCADDAIQVLIDEQRSAEKTDPQRTGFDRVTRTVRMANVGFRYEAYVRPAEADRPIDEKYGDHFLGCEFGRYRGNGGWDLWNFLRVTVIDADGKPHPIIGHERQVGFVRMQEGDRGVADALWELPRGTDGKPAGLLALRIIKRPDWEEWFGLEVAVEAPEGWSLGDITASCYPYNTSKDPNAPRERWVATQIRDLQTTDQWIDCVPNAEWAFMLYNRLSQENAGCLLVCDPDELRGLAVSGTYAVMTRATPKPGQRSCRFAFGYFADEPARDALGPFQAQAPDIVRFLRQVDWSVRPKDIRDLTAHRQDFDDLAGLDALPADLRAQARTVGEELYALWGATGDRKLTRPEERRYAETARRYQDLHEAMQSEWLKVLPPLTE